MDERGNRGHEKGLALVSVLWALSILSLIAAVVMSTGILSYRMERNAWRQTEADMIAAAAVNRAILGLTDSRPETRWRTDGVPQDFVFAGTTVHISIEDELGKIDLNTASDDLLRGLFHAARLKPDVADALTDNVLDWRSKTGLAHLNGAGAEEQKKAGSRYSPRHGPFQSIDELKLVSGMTPEIFAKLAPAVTIYSQRSTIDPEAASKLALLALPGMDAERAGALIAARGGGAPRPGVIDAARPLAGRAFTIRLAFLYESRSISKTVVARLTGNAAGPYWLLASE